MTNVEIASFLTIQRSKW